MFGLHSIALAIQLAPPPEPGTPTDPDGVIVVEPAPAPSNPSPGTASVTSPIEPGRQPAAGEQPGKASVQLADSGDARHNAPPTADPLLKAEGKLGAKQMPASVAIYGIIAANAVYDSGSVGPSDESPVFATVGSNVGDGLATDGAFLVTSRQTRIGVKANIQLTETLDMAGNVEIDFFGLHDSTGPAGIVQPGLRLRLAKLEFGSAKHRLIAGQDWSVITPRLPTSLSHMIVAPHTQSGAVWSRIPQITYLFKQPIAKASKLGNARFQLALSVARNFSGDQQGTVVRFDLPDPGTASRLPVAQARIAFESDMFSIGAGGEVGRETHRVARLDAQGNPKTIDDDVPIWMVTGDMQVKTKWMWLMGEGYYGVNINGMLSNQGVRHDTWTEAMVGAGSPLLDMDRDIVSLPGYGGWAELGFLLGTPKVKLFGSAGADIGRGDLVAEGARWLNIGALTGLIYAPFDVFDMSLEYQRINSYYHHDDRSTPLEQRLGTNNYVATTFRFKF